jgi:ABC-type branched-subunit amino acid transport system ATPase component/ABC-type branched-subunit amino acid transport system permease subunit
VTSALRYLLMAAVMGTLLAVPLAAAGSYVKFMLILVFIYSIVAIGLNIVAGYAGQLSLGHAAFMAVGAYISAGVSKALESVPLAAATGMHVWLGMMLGTAAAGLAGAVLAFPAMRLKGPYLAMVTIAFGWMVWRILLEWVSVTGGDLGIAAIPRPRFGSLTFDITGFYYLALAAVAIACILQRNLVESDVGRKYRALRHSEIAAAAVGIAVYREKVSVFVLSALFAGFGGALFAHLQNFINPDNFQFFTSLFFLLAVLFGGAGTLVGPVVGAAFLTILPEVLQQAEHFRLIIYGLIILATLFLLPRGLAGLLPTFRSKPAPAQWSGEPRTQAIAVHELAGRGAPRRAVLAVEGAEKSFGGIRALANASIAVTAGSVHAVIGPNGAGKTTLINIMSGLYRPGGGTISLDGRNVVLESLHDAALRGIARTFQTVRLFGDMTVREHVMVGCEPHAEGGLLDALLRTPRARREERRRARFADELIAFVGLAPLADVPADTLAYGHRRLLEIARALATRPRLLLLDEPAAGLVASEIEAMARLIEDLRQARMAILLVEHHLDLVMQVADVVTVLDRGEVISRGDPATVRRDPRVIEAYLGTDFGQENVDAQG